MINYIFPFLYPSKLLIFKPASHFKVNKAQIQPLGDMISFRQVSVAVWMPYLEVVSHGACIQVK